MRLAASRGRPDHALEPMNNRQNTALENEWFLERERAVAWLRLGFALLAIAVIQLNPSRVARYPELSTITLASFLIYSGIAVWLVVKRKSTFGVRWARLRPRFDTIWIAFIVISTGGTRTPFFFYYSFPVITASLRWGLKGSLPVAFVGVAIYATIRLSLAAESGSRTDRHRHDRRAQSLFNRSCRYLRLHQRVRTEAESQTLGFIEHAAGQLAAAGRAPSNHVRLARRHPAVAGDHDSAHRKHSRPTTASAERGDSRISSQLGRLDQRNDERDPPVSRRQRADANRSRNFACSVSKTNFDFSKD